MKDAENPLRLNAAHVHAMRRTNRAIFAALGQGS